MLWLAAYLTGFPPVGLHALCWTHGLAPDIAALQANLFDSIRLFSHILFILHLQFNTRGLARNEFYHCGAYLMA